MKLFQLVKFRVETKIAEIIPPAKRTKRGLINIAGTFFKAITGNLDASDGEKYDKIIKDLQSNDKELTESLLTQNAISVKIIDKFNSTINLMRHNDLLLESKINQISTIVYKTTYKENLYFIKDIINQIVNVYEVINSILQDIENSITFSKLKIMHPSIVGTEDLYNELKLVEKRIGIKQMPIIITKENILLLEKFIKVESYISNNKITYVIQIPIVLPDIFEYYHLYSIPVFNQSRFKAILPFNKFLSKNELQYAYSNQKCEKIEEQVFICQKQQIQNIGKNSPCEVMLLNSKSKLSCNQIEVQISEAIIEQLDNTNQWVLVLPNQEPVKLKCFNQEEIQNLMGTYLMEVPNGCQITTNSKFIINGMKIMETRSQPILFPDFNETPPVLSILNPSLHMLDPQLDGLHQLRNQLVNIKPNKSLLG